MFIKIELDELVCNNLRQRELEFSTEAGYVRKRLEIALKLIAGCSTDINVNRNVFQGILNSINSYDFTKVQTSGKYVKICNKCNRNVSIRVFAKAY